MERSAIDDKAFIELFESLGAAELSRRIGITERNVLGRRSRLERRLNREILPPKPRLDMPRPKEYPHRSTLNVPNGIVIVASDFHYWPGEPSLLHRALVAACREYKPKAVVLNGDVIDAPTVSRHPPIGWEKRPKLSDEIETAKDRCHEIVTAAGGAERIWNLGNHDARFETRLAHVAPEYAKIHGVHLSDHFPLWQPAWACWINDTLVVKHRFKGGIHAPHNNTMWAGKSMATGHLHSAKVVPFTDYNGTRYGVDTGCIADCDHDAFVDYTEDAPKNWRSAFGIFTFKDGQLLMPELVTKWDDKRVQFRGDVFAP